MLKSKRTDELVDFYLIALEFKAQLSKVLNISGSESSSIEFVSKRFVVVNTSQLRVSLTRCHLLYHLFRV